MRSIVLATRNKGKLREFTNAFGDSEVRLIALSDYPDAPDVEESGDTYEANALQKAEAVASYTGLPTLADDSGIEIDALADEFGVRSARQAGDRPYNEVNADILERMSGVVGDDRAARYIAALAFVDPSTGQEEIVRGVFEGLIHDRLVGSDGFGFDPIFYLPEYGRTVAEIPLSEKNKISHRAKAIALMKKILFGG